MEVSESDPIAAALAALGVLTADQANVRGGGLANLAGIPAISVESWRFVQRAKREQLS